MWPAYVWLWFIVCRDCGHVSIRVIGRQSQSSLKPLLKGHPFGRTREAHRMSLKLGPAGVPLSCKGRTIVEGMDDITVLGLDAMEVQTVRTIQPQHFDQYWQAGILSWKSDFEMNMHGPY